MNYLEVQAAHAEGPSNSITKLPLVLRLLIREKFSSCKLNCHLCANHGHVLLFETCSGEAMTRYQEVRIHADVDATVNGIMLLWDVLVGDGGRSKERPKNTFSC